MFVGLIVWHYYRPILIFSTYGIFRNYSAISTEYRTKNVGQKYLMYLKVVKHPLAGIHCIIKLFVSLSSDHWGTTISAPYSKSYTSNCYITNCCFQVTVVFRKE